MLLPADTTPLPVTSPSHAQQQYEPIEAVMQSVGGPPIKGSSQGTAAEPISHHGADLGMEPPELAAVLDGFPPVEHAFAYGSGVFRQPGLYSRGAGKPMLDFIFAVQSPHCWHEQVRPRFWIQG